MAEFAESDQANRLPDQEEPIWLTTERLEEVKAQLTYCAAVAVSSGH
jgi:hypothetical protein